MVGNVGILYILISTHFMLSEGGEDLPKRVNGLTNQSIVLPLPLDPSRILDVVYWTFQNNMIASYIKSQLKVIKGEFKGRLEMLDNGRALKIGQLGLEDSGLHTATITYTGGASDIASYNLTVYELVPVPTIGITEKKKNSDGCNVTLHCSVPANTSSLSYTWKYRHGGSDYQSYVYHGGTIQISLQLESQDMEVMCIVQNPADQKSVSAKMNCLDYNRRHAATGKQGRGYYAFLAFLMVPLAFLGWYCYEMKKKRRKGSSGVQSQSHTELRLFSSPADADSDFHVPVSENVSTHGAGTGAGNLEPERTNTEEITGSYAKLMLTSNEPNQVPKENCRPPRDPSEDIVYSTLRHDKDSSGKMATS